MMFHLLVAIGLVALGGEASAAGVQLSPADEAAAFKAAGYVRKGKHWRGGCDDPGTASYMPPEIQTVRDLNGDGRPEAVIVEGGTYCYGNTGQGFQLVSQQADGSWRRIFGDTGMANFLATRGADGWPDIEVGGPGFCFPVRRWNGREYVLNRTQYDGKPCRRP